MRSKAETGINNENRSAKRNRQRKRKWGAAHESVNAGRESDIACGAFETTHRTNQLTIGSKAKQK